VRKLTLVVHGESGVGKSFLADTTPGPRLVFDAEGGTRWTPSKKVQWDPKMPIPELGSDDTAVVTVLDLDSLYRAFQWLSQGKHPFRSVIMDSLTEVQKRTINAVSGQAIPQGKDWQAILNKLDNLVRAFRDLTLNEIKPVEVVVFICGSKEYGTAEHAVIRPMLQGQMANLLPYSVDVMAYMEVGVGAEGSLERKALFANVQGIAAKDRTGRLGVSMDNPTVPKILDLAYGPKEGT
jgi:AAA domain-containing protein